MKTMPHNGSYTRLQISPIHGVGVFAIRDIPKGTNIFAGDEADITWIERNDIKDIDPSIRKLYDDFCIIKGDKLGCPKNFNLLTVAWYLNESKNDPNVECNDAYDFFTLRDIRAGEELLSDYSTYSEYPQ